MMEMERGDQQSCCRLSVLRFLKEPTQGDKACMIVVGVEIGIEGIRSDHYADAGASRSKLGSRADVIPRLSCVQGFGWVDDKLRPK